MKTQHTYYQWSTALFEGFYDSNLYNSDTEIHLSELLETPSEIKDFGAYTQAVAEKACTLLDPENEFLSDFVLTKIDSPDYYNFRTDRLVISCLADFELLTHYAYTLHPTEFNTYLHDNFTSYDGFCSFVPNNLADFQTWSQDSYHDDNAKDVLIEFYLLSTIDLDSYTTTLHEKALDLQMEYAEPSDSPDLVNVP